MATQQKITLQGRGMEHIQMLQLTSPLESSYDFFSVNLAEPCHKAAEQHKGQ
jgi:hypothetical protein